MRTFDVTALGDVEEEWRYRSGAPLDVDEEWVMENHVHLDDVEDTWTFKMWSANSI